MKSRINYDILVGFGGTSMPPDKPRKRGILITDNIKPSTTYGWSFWWTIISIIVFGILFILAIKKGLI